MPRPMPQAIVVWQRSLSKHRPRMPFALFNALLFCYLLVKPGSLDMVKGVDNDA